MRSLLSRNIEDDLSPHSQLIERLRNAIQRKILGKKAVVELAITAVIARGHLLIEDHPGVGKSSLARSMAEAIGGSFRRIQFTSDMLPGDLLGVNVWSTKREQFEFRPGPVFSNVVLADEINRSPPRTQGALLEAMGENQVSIDGESHTLPNPFLVLATQNPEDHHGTYPLPESQRDRFMVRLSMGYVPPSIEIKLLQSQGISKPVEHHTPAVQLHDLLRLQSSAQQVFVHEDIARYAQAIVQATRNHARIRIGVSTRGALAWIAAAKAKALQDGRTMVIPDDLQELAVPTLGHRLMLRETWSSTTAEIANEILHEIISSLDVPR